MRAQIIRSLFAVVVASMIGGCNGGGVSTADAAPDGTGGPVDALDNPDPAAPRILSLQVNTPTIDETETLTVTSIVTDPDGIDDLIGGTLEDPATARSYGAFATAAAEGAYQISMAWSSINTVGPINAPPEGVERTFRATFYDVAGHAAQRDVVVMLGCKSDVRSACEGRCFALATDEANCGACEHACPDAAHADTWCGEGACLRKYQSTEFRSCDAECATTPKHPHCSSAKWAFENGFVGPLVIDGTCSERPPFGHEGRPFQFIECVCQE